MKIVVNTQVLENYASHSSSFVPGVDTPRWKFKGGSSYVVAHMSYQEAADLGQTGMQDIVDGVASNIECDDESLQEYILDWDIIEDDDLPHGDELQLKYEGRIDYPSKDFTADGPVCPVISVDKVNEIVDTWVH